jgi:hypothetical protein
MSTTGDQVRARVCSLCASEPFAFTQANTPFDFLQQPSGSIDQAFRVTLTGDKVIGGFNFTEDRTDRLDIWLARKQTALDNETYTQLCADAAALRAAVIRDGATNGEYSVPDSGASVSIQHESGREYAVLRLTLATNYEVAL